MLFDFVECVRRSTNFERWVHAIETEPFTMWNTFGPQYRTLTFVTTTGPGTDSVSATGMATICNMSESLSNYLLCLANIFTGGKFQE